MNALDPAGPVAQAIGSLFWWMVGVAALVYVTVLVAFAVAWKKGRRQLAALGDTDPSDAPPDVLRPSPRQLGIGVGIAAGITILILFAFLVADLGVNRALAAGPAGVVTIDLQGVQWWWKATYADNDPSKIVVTANEIHIPVGVPVQLRLTSNDVIHSVWIPSLAGKKDLVPGYTSRLWLRADRPGVYRGQCAEFCGHQHAKMGLTVVAQPSDEFNAWLEHQRQPAPAPDDSITAQGQKVFLTGPCAKCHTIAGTPAAATVGPNLTHLASRLTIAAGSLPMTRGALGGWIVDPQGIKPGARMPSNQLQPDQLQSLIAYLATLR